MEVKRFKFDEDYERVNNFLTEQYKINKKK